MFEPDRKGGGEIHKPSTHEFQSRERLLKTLGEKAHVLENRFFAPRSSSIKELVKESVGGNTFRAFHIKRFGLSPSKVYRDWVTEKLEASVADFRRISCAEEHQEFLFRTVEGLRRHWSEATKGRHEIEFGRAAKLLNLSLKFLLRYSEIEDAERTTIIRFLHVPLDSFTLRGVHVLLPGLNIPRNASMGFVKDRDTYLRIQDGIRNLCAPDFYPVHYELLAWDKAHEKSQS